MAKSRNYIAIPPGSAVKEKLNACGMSQKEFAVRMSMSEKHISKLINGDVQLTPEVAMRLELVLGVPAGHWNKLEAEYREKIVKAETERALGADASLSERFPYEEMARLGWVPEAQTTAEKTLNLRKYFGVVSLSLLSNDQIMRLTCHKSPITEKNDLTLLAWAQEARLKAREIPAGAVNPNGLAEDIAEIRSILSEESGLFSPELKEKLATYGIVMVFVPDLRGTAAYGALFPDGNRIVLGLSQDADPEELRHNFFHALGHIVLGHTGRQSSMHEEDERAADFWADAQLEGQPDA